MNEVIQKMGNSGPSKREPILMVGWPPKWVKKFMGKNTKNYKCEIPVTKLPPKPLV